MNCSSLSVLCIGLLLTLNVSAQQKILRSNKNVVSIRTGDKLLSDYWTLTPQVKPDVYEVTVKESPVPVTFISDADSLRFNVKSGDVYSFIIVSGSDSAYTEIRGLKFIEPAVFSNEYKKKFNGKTITEIPEVYELVNAVMSVTEYQRKVSWYDEKRTPYYQEVQAFLKPYESHPLIAAVNSLLNRGYYRYLKTDSYAYLFNSKGKIVRSPVFDRVDGQTKNTLIPILELLQDFSDKSGFRRFFKEHAKLYEEQVSAYRDSINIADMVEWLNYHFPSTRYNCFRIIWSPLVGGNQSSKWFNNNGFKEAQAHVNFPYSFLFTGSQQAINIARGNIVFTEINHSFINPEAEKYHDEVETLFKDKFQWARKGSAAEGYAILISDLFNEYMNWGLVVLRYIDKVPPQELEPMIQRNVTFMVNRGFLKYAEYIQFITELYKNRKPGQTLASLYPDILQWFKANQ